MTTVLTRREAAPLAALLCLLPLGAALAGCPSKTATDADTDKKMRESFAKPLKVSDLPPEAQAIVKKGTPPAANAPR